MANSLVFHIMLKKGSEVPKVSVQLKFIGAGSNTEHLGLSQSYLPHPNSESCAAFFDGLLVLQGIFCQNFKFFSQPARPVPKISVQFEFIGICLNLEHLGLS